MEILVNGEARQVPDNMSAAELIESMGLADKRIAMEINRDIVPRSQHPQYHLQPGDVVEIVFAIGGG